MDEEQLLNEYNNRKIKEYALVISFVAIACILGIFGNAVAIMFYGSKKDQTVTTFLLTALSVNDLIASVVLLDNIFDFVYTVTYTSAAGCKISLFLNHVFIKNSLFLLLAVGIDRYFRICLALSPNMKFSRAQARTLLVGTVVLTILLSFRELVTKDSVQVDVPVGSNKTVVGFHCTYSEDENLQTIITVGLHLDMGIIITIIATLTVLYILIGRKVRFSREKFKAHENSLPMVNDRDRRKRIISHRSKSSLTEEVVTGSTTLPEHSNVSPGDIRENETDLDTANEDKSLSVERNAQDKGSKEQHEQTDTFKTTVHNLNEQRNYAFDTNEGSVSTEDQTVSRNVHNDVTESVTGKCSLEANIACITRGDSSPHQCDKVFKSNTSESLHHAENSNTSGENATYKQQELRTDTAAVERKKKRVERRITKMAFAVTAASVLCFVPFFIASTVVKTYDHTVSVWVHLPYRSFVLNNIVNPYVMGYFNTEFRHYVVERLLCRQRGR